MKSLSDKLAQDIDPLKRRMIPGVVGGGSEFEKFVDDLNDAMVLSAFTFCQHLRLNLLQDFRDETKNWIDLADHPEFESWALDKSEFARTFLLKHCPDSYSEFFSLLDGDEIEIFLKLWPIAHESFGTAKGIEQIVSAFLQHAASDGVPVAVSEGMPWTRAIPQRERSYLGKQHSSLGKKFTLGRKLTECQSYYRVYVGPISPEINGRLQGTGWLQNLKHGIKLHMLLALMQPYYKKPITFVKIKDIDATGKFVLRNSILGKSTILANR